MKRVISAEIPPNARQAEHPSMKPLWHARVKLMRAKKHIEEAATEYERFRSSEPIEILAVKVDFPENEPQNFSVNVKHRNLDTPYLTTAIVGDAIHNIRAALDVMACEFVREMGGNDKGVYFPFAENAEKLDDQIKSKNFSRAGVEAAALLKTFEPYRGGNLALRGLHDADNEDKHSRLASTEYQIAAVRIRMTKVDGRLIPVPEMDTVRELIGDCTFPSDSGFPGEPVFPTLQKLTEIVQEIIEAFSTLLISLKEKSA